MERNYQEEITSLQQEIDDLKKQLAVEKADNQKLRDQLAGEHSDPLKPSIKRALAQAGTEEGDGA